MAQRKLFSGLIFLLASAETYEKDSVQKVITENGGALTSIMNEKVSFVIAPYQIASEYGNEYKMQFYTQKINTPPPESEIGNIITTAMTFHIPIVSPDFLFGSLKNSKLEYHPYLVFGKESNDIIRESTLDKRVQDVVMMIFDKAAQQQSLIDLQLDSKQIASVNETKIKEAYKILNQLENAIQLKTSNSTSTKEEASKNIKNLSSSFYSIIPHSSKEPPSIDNQDILKQKLSMLEVLTDILIANKITSDVSTPRASYSINTVDLYYKKLKTKITPLEKFTHEYDIISQSISNTHAKIHSYFEVELVDVFTIEREGEDLTFEAWKTLPHHRLLWHGSRLTNFAGILSQGLRIAPPEAPVTGYFLGKGIYFGDMTSKSVEYTHPSVNFPYVLMILNEVALGRVFQVAHTKFISKEDLTDAGYHSTKGCGEKGPDPAYDYIMPNSGEIISLGKEAPTGVLKSELPHNEYVVYDTSQVKMKYLVKLKVISDRAVKAQSLVNTN